MREQEAQQDPRAVGRVAQHVWIAAAFIFMWMHFSYWRPNLRHPDWQIYSLYFTGIAGVATRYLTGMRHGHRRWHRVVFDGLFIVFIAVGVNLTGGIRSDLWLVYFIFVIAETLVASARGFVITDGAAIVSYVIATLPRTISQEYLEQLITRVVFLILVASIARTVAANERQRQGDLGALREELSVSEERRRLARDLHDGIGHVLTRVILSLEVIRRQCMADPKAAADGMGQQAVALRGAMEEMRQIVATLRTDTTAFDLRSALRSMTARLAETESLEVDVHLPQEPIPLSLHRQYHLSRVIQEALTNCLRHSGAKRACVDIRVSLAPTRPPAVVAEIRDEGVGFDPEGLDSHQGHGLAGMQERLAPYEGRVQVESAPGAGTRVIAELPADVPLWESIGRRALAAERA